MKQAARIGITLAVLGWVNPALAGTYTWTDANGTLHFSDDENRAARSGGTEHEPFSAPAADVREPAPAAASESATAVLGAALPRPNARGEIRIPFERDGHLIRLTVRLNHRIEVPFYLDTGSSGVVLPRSFAKRLGLATGPAAPTVTLHTTAGPMQVPAVQLECVQLGGAEIENLEATVSPSIEIGLLGGEFFNQFSYSIDPVAKVMVLRRVSSPK